MRSTYFLLILMIIALLSALPVEAQFMNDFSSLKNKQKYEKIRISRILGTDAFVLENGEKIKLIGLKGIMAPKKVKIERDEKGERIIPETPFVALEDRAIEFMRTLLEGKYVRLEFDEEKIDADFKTLAYAFTLDEGTFVNAEIIRQGYATLSIRPPNLKYAERLREAYQEAFKEKTGLLGD